MRLEHGIVIRAEMSRYALRTHSGVEHTADVGGRGGAALDADADEAARELVHDDEHPVTSEHNRLAAKEVDAPEAVCGVADERQPEGPVPGAGR